MPIFCSVLDVKEEFPPESDGKPKRKRTTFSSAQLVHLENNYTLENRYLTRLKRIQLAAELGLSEKQVKVWFQNRRVRDKPKDDIKPSMRGKRVKYEDIQVKNEMTNTPCNDSRGSTPPCENFTISNMWESSDKLKEVTMHLLPHQLPFILCSFS